MKLRYFILAIVSSVLSISGCAQQQEIAHHPDWTYNSVVYEVNVRQYSPEGTFSGVQAQLPRLKGLGVDVLWLMPIYEIGQQGRKGTLGSYYAISNYEKVNPEFGTMADFDSLLSAAHRMGFKLILDWVANQTAPDNIWMTQRPANFYERDSLGNATYEYDWDDTRSLNYENQAVWAAQDSSMRFWLSKGVDGFRCDAAGEVPAKFWRYILPGLKKDYPQAYFLAEAEKPELDSPDSLFDALYAWELHHLMNGFVNGEKTVKDLREYITKDSTSTPSSAFRLTFTSNHDENSWHGTEFERMGASADLCSVLCFTLPKSQPLIYTGQEIGLNRRLKFFEKDPIVDWSSNIHTLFFKRLISLKHNNPALLSGEKGGKMTYIPITGVSDDILAFSRKVKGNEVIVVANVSPKIVSFVLPLKHRYSVAFRNGEGYGEEKSNDKYKGDVSVTLQPWGWLVLTK